MNLPACCTILFNKKQFTFNKSYLNPNDIPFPLQYTYIYQPLIWNTSMDDGCHSCVGILAVINSLIASSSSLVTQPVQPQTRSFPSPLQPWCQASTLIHLCASQQSRDIQANATHDPEHKATDKQAETNQRVI